MFKGKTAIVTGAGSGIGRALAIALAKENCNLVLIDKAEEDLDLTADMITDRSIKVSKHIADLSDEKQVCNLQKKVLSIHGKTELLFNVAGVAAGGNFEELETDVFENAMKINFLSMVYMMKAFWGTMKEAPQAHIINMSSVTGKAAFAKNSAYSASKFAITGFTNSVAYELENSSIKFSVVYPGAICTNISVNSISSGGNGDPNARHIIANGMNPHKAAEIILKGVRKGKREIVVGADAKTVLLIQRILPTKYWSIIKRFVRL
ncbi:MAG: SDR family NAD(P)-dependent oxidoreductase [Ruminococcus sp.]|nr:SDR family NAD(P)-dependent oxidoreductase [Ruminococcus sp.]